MRSLVGGVIKKVALSAVLSHLNVGEVEDFRIIFFLFYLKDGP